MSALMVAGLFYLGSGVGLGIGIRVRRLRQSPQSATANHRIPRAELPWLMGAILAGGVAGPALLMLGLSSTSAASSSLLLNLESVLTAAIAWVAIIRRGALAGDIARAAFRVLLGRRGIDGARRLAACVRAA